MKPENKNGLLLLSGGIDSPVAAHLMQKKDYEITALHFYNKHISDVNTIDKCKTVCKILKIKTIYLIPFDEQQAEVVRKCRHKYYYVITRRLMWRIAEKLAQKENIKYLITGENLAQVSSQTLSNLTTTDRATKMQILRPILCNDKIETIRIARNIGTYESSIGPEVCCVLGPKHPVTSSKPEIIEEEEKRLDISNLITTSLNAVESIEIMRPA